VTQNENHNKKWIDKLKQNIKKKKKLRNEFYKLDRKITSTYTPCQVFQLKSE
jgi:uncharacterized membrane protein YkvA (DUF1232 family)